MSRVHHGWSVNGWWGLIYRKRRWANQMGRPFHLPHLGSRCWERIKPG